MTVRGVAQGLLVALAAGALLLFGAGPAAVADRDRPRPSPGDEASRPADPGARSGLRSLYPYLPPEPPPEPEPPPPPDVPAICLERSHIVCASKGEKTLRYFESGALWLSTLVAFGRPGYETPSGLWSVRVKDANAFSYEFNTPMPYSLEYDLVRGIYIHYSATYASVGPGYVGSHGCINIGDLSTAKSLFDRVPVGAAVYVY